MGTSSSAEPIYQSPDLVARNMVGAWNARQTNRYQKPHGPEDMHHMLLKSEKAFADLIGTKYALGVNSGGIAITLIIEHLSTRVKSKVVYTNAFTFNAVPSSIVNANMKPCLVECTPGLVLDLEDLKAKFISEGGKILVLSYMRGFVPNVEEIVALCEKYDVLLIEDAAHAYGIEYKNQKIGSFGVAAAVSTQSNKLVNTGEGGYILTDDADLMARSIIRSGCYEQYWQKHDAMTPPEELVMKYIFTTPNLSVRLSNVQGAMALAQFDDIQERIDMLNKNHSVLKEKLEDVAEVITQIPEVTRPVYDSIQIRLKGLNMDQCRMIETQVKKKFKFQIFLHEANARYFGSWRFMKAGNLPKTTKSLQNVFDMRIRHDASAELLNDIASTIRNSIQDALNQESTI